MNNFLNKYNGTNPYIHKLKSLPILNDFQKEYLNGNKDFIAIKLGFTINIDDKNIILLNKQGIKFDKNFIFVEELLGETDKFYHFLSKDINFFLNKVGCDNPREKIAGGGKKLFSNFHHYDNNNLKGYKLFDHHKIGIEFLMNTKRGFLFDDMGLSKTAQSIIAAIECQSKKTLIITLASVTFNHQEEVQNYLKKAEIIKDSNFDKNSDFFIINYEKLKKYVCYDKNNIDYDFKNFGFDTIIIDEVHEASNVNSIEGKCIRKICQYPSVKRVWGLSGTPFENNYKFWDICVNLGIEIPNVIPKYFASKYEYNTAHTNYLNTYCHITRLPSSAGFVKKRLGNIQKSLNDKFKDSFNYKTFLRIVENNSKMVGAEFYMNVGDEWKPITSLTSDEYKYCLKHYNIRYMDIIGKKDAETGIILKNKNSDELGEKIKHLYLRRITDEVFTDFAKKDVSEYLVELNPTEKEAYDGYFDAYKAKKEEKGDNIENLGKSVELIKMAELLSVFKVPHTINFVKNLINKGEKCIIYTHFEAEMDTFEELIEDCGLTKKTIFVKSKDSAKKRHKKFGDFQKDSNFVLLIGNINVIGTGSNLTKGDNLIFNSPDWSNSKHEQAEKRSHRIGRIDDVNIIYILFKDTEEIYIYKVSKEKKDNTDKVFKF